MAKEFIEITDNWWDALNSSAFVSCKFLLLGTLPTKIFFLLSRTQRQNHSLVEGKFETSAAKPQKKEAKSFGYVRLIPNFVRRAEVGGAWSSSWRECLCRQQQCLRRAKCYWQRWRWSKLAKLGELDRSSSFEWGTLRAATRGRRNYVRRHNWADDANETHQRQIKYLSSTSNFFSFFKLSSAF